jgi:hypothetical protein
MPNGSLSLSEGTSELWRGKGGSGLGLTISERFVRLHGGRMWLESELGVGSTFIIELPISAPVEHSARPGHQIREDWIWVERESRPGFAAVPAISRVVVCDQVGDLYSTFAHYSSDVEFIGVRDLDGSLGNCRNVQHTPW